MPTESATIVIRINRKAGEAWYGDIKSASGSQQNFHNIQELLSAIDCSLNSSKAYSL